MAKIRSVRTTRIRMELVLNKVKARLGHGSIGAHTLQSHGYVIVKKAHPSYVKSLLSSLRSTFDDFEFDQVNYKDQIVVRFRTVGSGGWYERG
jgi:hypothetical protein